ncbi:hypothetical protein HJC23_010936 [Cyclotella cryptica]|uniref:Glycosyltransferase family 92 protein n=1 Tax=Cyclotella cryptica TaxID=29204 RepID=A0ABD3Q9X5_9STRA
MISFTTATTIMHKGSNRRFIHKKKSSGYFGKHAFRLFVVSSIILSIGTLLLSWKAIQNNVSNDHGSSALQSQLQRPPNPKEIEKHFREHMEFKNEPEIREKKTAVHAKSKGKKSTKEDPLPAPPSEQLTNSQIYQPDRTRGKRLLTYKRFGGRLNNQLFQFITALQHAKALKRTLVVPDEIREVDWTGMFDTAFGIWDMDSLNQAYDIDWTSGLSNDFVTPDECLMHWSEAPQLLKGGPSHWEEWDAKCPDVINIAGNTGLLFCERQHQFCGDAEAQREAYEIYRHLKLSEDILEYIPSKREEFKDLGYDQMAIHSRRAGEGGYNWELGNRKTCIHHLDLENGGRFCDERTMKGNCAVWMDLDYQVKSKSALKKSEKDYRFVLASDGTHDWSIDFNGQFVVANNTEWLLSLEKRALDKVKSGKSLEKAEKSKGFVSDMGNVGCAYGNASRLIFLGRFQIPFGAYYSTLSFNACYFRGVDRMYDSNMCWMLMHSETKLAIPPPVESTVHVGGDQANNMPAALMSDVEHAFVRSKDEKFIAIDRYLVSYQRPGANRHKEVIGVLGDGLVPITLEKDRDGKETIRADFTCSMGNQHNTPATVLLMKGNKSYHEHYYVQGEKYNTSFSTNGDRFRTLIILCEDLHYDKSLSRYPPLVLKSNDDSFYVSIGSTFARPMGRPLTKRNQFEEKTNGPELVHCLNPVYGLKDPRWIIEYLEYHRAIGVTHVHVYNVDLHSPDVQAVLQVYRAQNFVTRHDWSSKASGQYTTRITYEHAKWAAQTDCALRSRGHFDYALFSDIDEIAVGNYGSNPKYPPGHLGPAIEACAAAKEKNEKIGCSFNSNTVTSVYTKLNSEEESFMKDRLMLERYDRIEASPHCPANCACVGNGCKEVTRKYHQGRQKYMMNVRDLSIQPRPMWTHAIARDYNEMDKVMEVLSDDLIHVRHFQGHWYLNKDLLNSMDEKEAPLSESILNVVSQSIKGTSELNEIYSKAKDAAAKTSSQGVEWIKPVDRPDQYHRQFSK